MSLCRTNPRSSTTITRRTALGLGLTAGSAVFLNAVDVAAPSATAPAQGNSVLGQGGGLHHVAIRTSDWARTLRFYENALGFTVKMAWRFGANPNRWAYLDSGNGGCVEIIEDSSFVPPPLKGRIGGEFNHLCLRTHRLDAVIEHLRAQGTKFEGPIAGILNTTTGQGSVPLRGCWLEGPSGERIEILENAP